MTLFKKKKKEVEYQTDLTIYNIFHIKAPEEASIFIEGTDPEFINITIITGATVYTINLKQEEVKDIQKDYTKEEYGISIKNMGLVLKHIRKELE